MSRLHDPALSAEQEHRLAAELRASAEQRPLTPAQRRDLVELLAADYRARGADLELAGKAPALARERCTCCGQDLGNEMAAKVRSFWFRLSHLRAAATRAA